MGGLMGHGAHLFPNTQNCQRVTKHSTAQGAPYRPPRRPHKGRLQPGHLVRPAQGGANQGAIRCDLHAHPIGMEGWKR